MAGSKRRNPPGTTALSPGFNAASCPRPGKAPGADGERYDRSVGGIRRGDDRAANTLGGDARNGEGTALARAADDSGLSSLSARAAGDRHAGPRHLISYSLNKGPMAKFPFDMRCPVAGVRAAWAGSGTMGSDSAVSGSAQTGSIASRCIARGLRR